MSFFFGLTAILLAAAAEPLGNPNETPASPISRRIPTYPVACMPKAGEAPAQQQVTVVFTVSRDGYTKDVRVRESTNHCFDETTIAAARSWIYEPRRVGGKAAPQEDLEATITFILEQPSQIDDFDARPIKRYPPVYPSKCMRKAERFESVYVEFDVTAEGTTENARVIDTTNPCLNNETLKAVAKWRYQPKTVGGVAMPRKGVQTKVEFQLEDPRKIPRPRDALIDQLVRIDRKLRSNGDAKQALVDLAALESRYGDSFTNDELSAFLQVRAQARIKAGDYAGALDDLRAAQRTGRVGEGGPAIVDVIRQLEAAIASQAATETKTKDQEVATPAPDDEDRTSEND